MMKRLCWKEAFRVWQKSAETRRFCSCRDGGTRHPHAPEVLSRNHGSSKAYLNPLVGGIAPAASTLNAIHGGMSTAVTQQFLEHSSPQLTNDVYANADPALRQAINLLPYQIGCDHLWLEGRRRGPVCEDHDLVGSDLPLFRRCLSAPGGSATRRRDIRRRDPIPGGSRCIRPDPWDCPSQRCV